MTQPLTPRTAQERVRLILDFAEAVRSEVAAAEPEQMVQINSAASAAAETIRAAVRRKLRESQPVYITPLQAELAHPGALPADALVVVDVADLQGATTLTEYTSRTYSRGHTETCSTEPHWGKWCECVCHLEAPADAPDTGHATWTGYLAQTIQRVTGRPEDEAAVAAHEYLDRAEGVDGGHRS